MPLHRHQPKCAYLYEGGILVEIFPDTRRHTQTPEYAVLTEGFCRTLFPGRFVIHSDALGYLPALKGATVQAVTPALEHGSPATQDLGLRVATVSWHTAHGLFVCLPYLPDLLSIGVTYQPDVPPRLQEWTAQMAFDGYPGTLPIRKVRRPPQHNPDAV